MQPTRAGKKTNSPNEASFEKYKVKVEKEFTSFCWKNGCRSRNQSNFNASNPQRWPQNISLQNAEKAWTFNHSWTYETWKMSIQQILMKDGTVPNLVFNDEKKFGVQQCLNLQKDWVWCRDGSVEGMQESKPTPESTFCDIVGGNHSHWEISTRFCTLRSETEQPALHFGHFGSRRCFPGHVSTLMVHLGLFNKTPLHHMAPKRLKAGFRPTFQRSLAKTNGPHVSQIWTLLTFMCGQFWRVRFAGLIMIRWIIWSWSCYENGPWECLREWASCKAFQGNWSLSLKIKQAILNKCFWLLL